MSHVWPLRFHSRVIQFCLSFLIILLFHLSNINFIFLALPLPRSVYALCWLYNAVFRLISLLIRLEPSIIWLYLLWYININVCRTNQYLYRKSTPHKKFSDKGRIIKKIRTNRPFFPLFENWPAHDNSWFNIGQKEDKKVEGECFARHWPPRPVRGEKRPRKILCPDFKNFVLTFKILSWNLKSCPEIWNHVYKIY